MNPLPAPPPPPLLAAPGAGLPKAELAAARLLFTWHRWVTSRSRAAAQITAERAALRALIGSLPPPACARRVLIPRLRGLEDSSRYWSVFMAVDHLRIVNASIAVVIPLLSEGRTPPRTASTASIKPSPAADAGAIPAFVESCDSIARAVAAVPDLRTAARYAHPWFGPLDAAGWHAMAGFHMELHRRQVESILAHLTQEQAAAGGQRPLPSGPAA